MSTRTLSGRVFVAMAAVCTIVAVTVTIAAFLVYEAAAVADAQTELGAECNAVASLVDTDDGEVASLESLDLGTVRATLVEPDGTVLYDSTVDASTLPNHMDREEVRQALYASKVIAYSQGFDQIAAASELYGWNVKRGDLARIWRGGCIIRAQFLNRITEAYERDPELPLLIARERPDLFLFPARWPETYSYTLSVAMRTGLPIIAPRLGAFGERLASAASAE